MTGFCEQRQPDVAVGILDRATGAARTLAADVLVGADGIHSAVRARHRTRDEGPPRYAGRMLWRATTGRRRS